MLRIARILFLDSLSDQGVLVRPEWTPWERKRGQATLSCLGRGKGV